MQQIWKKGVTCNTLISEFHTYRQRRVSFIYSFSKEYQKNFGRAGPL